MELLLDVIPLEHLKVDTWYVGRGRNGNVGLWNGRFFLVIGEKREQSVIKKEPYYTDESGCFQPFLAINEGRMVEPFGRLAWDAHYGRKMAFELGNG